MAIQLDISNAAYDYLRIQVGAISHIQDWKSWYEALMDFIDDQVNSLLPALYAGMEGKSLLSIGAGMGHIELVIQSLFSAEGKTLAVDIVDGTDDDPIVKYHRQPFSNAAVAQQFWEANGGKLGEYYNPGLLPKGGPPYDIIMGLGSWGFHFSPGTYLRWAATHAHEGTIWVMDNRKGKPEWKDEMLRHFKLVQVLQEDDKRERIWWAKK